MTWSTSTFLHVVFAEAPPPKPRRVSHLITQLILHQLPTSHSDPFANISTGNGVCGITCRWEMKRTAVNATSRRCANFDADLQRSANRNVLFEVGPSMETYGPAWKPCDVVAACVACFFFYMPSVLLRVLSVAVHKARAPLRASPGAASETWPTWKSRKTIVVLRGACMCLLHHRFYTNCHSFRSYFAVMVCSTGFQVRDEAPPYGAAPRRIQPHHQLWVKLWAFRVEFTRVYLVYSECIHMCIHAFILWDIQHVFSSFFIGLVLNHETSKARLRVVLSLPFSLVLTRCCTVAWC